MKCEPALTEGRGQASSLRLPLTVPLFMRLTFAGWKGPANRGKGKHHPQQGPSSAGRSAGAVPGCAGAVPCCRAAPASPPALPRGDPVTSRQLPAAFPSRHSRFLPGVRGAGSVPGKPWPSCPCLRCRRMRCWLLLRGPEGGHGTGCWGLRGQPLGTSLRCPLPICAVPGACCRMG